VYLGDAVTVFTDQFLVQLPVLGCGQSLECGFVLEVGDVHVHFPGFHDCWPPLYLPLELFSSEVPGLFACSRVLCPQSPVSGDSYDGVFK
jgi:hypothetical protein